MDLRKTTKDEREMTLVSQEPRIDIGELAGKPFPVGARNKSVLLTVHQQYRNVDLTQVETPWRRERDTIVDPAISTLPAPLTHIVKHEFSIVFGEHRSINWA